MAQEEGNVVQLEGIIHAFFREDGSLVIMTRKIDGNVWNASYGEEVTLSQEGVSNLRRLLDVVAVEQSRALDGATCASHECGGDMEASLTCKVCGETRPASNA